MNSLPELCPASPGCAPPPGMTRALSSLCCRGISTVHHTDHHDGNSEPAFRSAPTPVFASMGSSPDSMHSDSEHRTQEAWVSSAGHRSHGGQQQCCQGDEEAFPGREVSPNPGWYDQRTVRLCGLMCWSSRALGVYSSPWEPAEVLGSISLAWASP